MAKCDRATDAEIEQFELKARKILSSVKKWDFLAKAYLEAILHILGSVAVDYGQGNGDLDIECSENWERYYHGWRRLNPSSLLDAINQLTEAGLGITVFVDTPTAEASGILGSTNDFKIHYPCGNA